MRLSVACNFDPDLIDVGDITDLSRFEDGTFGSIICLGVLPHIVEMDKAIQELVRVSRPGAIHILSFRNDLFDLFTFNSFTMQFHNEHFIDLLPVDEGEKAKARDLLRGLVTHPDVPSLDYSPSADGFGDLTRINSNPLTIGDDLKGYGLSHLKTGFYKFHPLPPLLSKHFPDFARWGAMLDEKLCFSWHGLLMASTFVSVFRRQ